MTVPRQLFSRTFVLAALLVLVAWRAEAQIVFPTNGAPGGSYVIAVVSDGYTTGEEWMFNRAVNGLVVRGLMADPFFSSAGSAFTIHKIFKAAPASGASSFKITPNYEVTNCYITVDPADTTRLINDAVKQVAPERIIVIGNYEGVSLGCSVDNWSYLSAGTREVGGVLEHEFGHLIAGLFDEYAIPPNSNYQPPPDVDGPNCSNAQFVVGGSYPWPAWMQIPRPPGTLAPTNPPGCGYYFSQIARPYEHCRMRSSHAEFCFVCSYFMKAALAPFLSSPNARNVVAPSRPILHAGFMLQPARPRDDQPPARGTPPTQPPATPERPPTRTADFPRQPVPGTTNAGPNVPSVRVLVELTQGSSTPRIVSVTDVSAAEVKRYQRTGNIAYGVVENGTILESGVVAGDPFQTRSYGVGAPHQVGTTTKTTVVVTIPNTTKAQLLGRSVGIQFYRLNPTTGKMTNGDRERVDPGRLQAYVGENQATAMAEVTAADLKKAINELP